jgi:hypothetical protein
VGALSGGKILHGGKGPRDEWVMELMERVEEGTLAGRGVMDLVKEGKCFRCQDEEVEENTKVGINEENRLDVERWWNK